MQLDKKICVVGAGHWGKNHIQTLSELGKLGGVVESNSSTQNNISNQYPNVLIYNSVDEALKSNKFSGFTVATPAETHYEITKKIILARSDKLVVSTPSKICKLMSSSDNPFNRLGKNSSLL